MDIVIDSEANREDHDEALVHTEPRAHEHDNTNHTEDHNTDTDRRLREEEGVYKGCASMCVSEESVCAKGVAAVQCGNTNTPRITIQIQMYEGGGVRWQHACVRKACAKVCGGMSQGALLRLRGSM